MRKTPEQKYKHAYNVGYRAGKKFALNGNGTIVPSGGPVVHTISGAVQQLPVQRPIDKWIKLLSLLKEVA